MVRKWLCILRQTREYRTKYWQSIARRSLNFFSRSGALIVVDGRGNAVTVFCPLQAMATFALTTWLNLKLKGGIWQLRVAVLLHHLRFKPTGV